MKFTPAYLKNKGQKVRFERKQAKENLRENKDIHLATLKKVRLEKKKCYNNNYYFFINRNGIIIYNPRNTYDDRLLGKCKLYNGIGIKPIYNIILKTHI